MIVMILEKVPTSLRGELSRWLIEPRTGIFIGHVSALVRDRLWGKCSDGSKTGGVLQIWSTNNEQRFQMRSFGDTSRQIVELEGLQLIKIPHNLDDKAKGSVIKKRLNALQKTATSARDLSQQS
jgi:CRISPR-associated protein Cas2